MDFNVPVFDGMAAAFAIIRVELDAEGRPVDLIPEYVNDAWVKTQGMEKEEIIGKKFFHIFPEADRQWLDHCYLGAYEGQITEFNEILETQDLYFNVQIYPMETGICACILKDAKEAVLRERSRQRELEMARHANKAKTTFLNNMSHDIRTPMNAIIGFTNLAIKHLDKPERAEDYLGKILTSSNHLLSLINDVLDMSRIESGKFKIEEKECSLVDVMHNLRNMLQTDIAAKQLDFFVETEDVVDENVVCDSLRLTQVLLNCASNAMKFTKPGGRITINISQKPEAPEGYADYVFIVKDTGIGMHPEFVKHIFEPFSREESSTVSGLPGTGLGMSITKNIVDMMQGDIKVESEVDKGTTVTVNLRFRKGERKQNISIVRELEGMRALVVDDDMNTCSSVTRMLRTIGMRSEWTTSGKEAIFRARMATQDMDPFKTYIIDWLIPDMNGVEVVRRIRSEIGDNAPIIILTAYDWNEIEDEAKAAGVTAFCAKPIFLSELYDILKYHSEPAADKEEMAAAAEADHRFQGKKILLAEDNELNREIARTLLEEKAGLQIDEVCDGKEAVEMVAKSPEGYYDLIFMDIQMPYMDGYAAARAIRGMDRPDVKALPIVAMTANAFEEDVREAMDAGMNAHLAKPMRPERLYEILEEYL